MTTLKELMAKALLTEPKNNLTVAGLLAPDRKKPSILGALQDPQFYKDMAGNVPDTLRGLLAQTAGAPVDITTTAMRPFGYNVPSEQVVGGTDWIGKKLGANTNNLPFKISSMIPSDASDLMKYGGAAMALALKSGDLPKDIVGGALSLPDSIKPLVQMTPSGRSAFIADNLYMRLVSTQDGRYAISYDPPWGSSSKKFYAVGDDPAQLIAAAKQRLSRSDKAVSSAKTASHNKSLLGKLESEFGENFTVKRSERSKSQYIIHEPSGTKIRISDHSLPLGYEQADIDLPIGMPVEEQLAIIKNYFKE